MSTGHNRFRVYAVIPGLLPTAGVDGTDAASLLAVGGHSVSAETVKGDRASAAGVKITVILKAALLRQLDFRLSEKRHISVHGEHRFAVENRDIFNRESPWQHLRGSLYGNEKVGGINQIPVGIIPHLPVFPCQNIGDFFLSLLRCRLCRRGGFGHSGGACSVRR